MKRTGNSRASILFWILNGVALLTVGWIINVMEAMILLSYMDLDHPFVGQEEVRLTTITAVGLVFSTLFLYLPNVVINRFVSYKVAKKKLVLISIVIPLASYGLTTYLF